MENESTVKTLTETLDLKEITDIKKKNHESFENDEKSLISSFLLDKQAKSSFCCFSITKRYQIALMTCLGFLIMFSIRCNMGIAMIKMLNKSTVVDKYGNKIVIVS